MDAADQCLCVPFRQRVRILCTGLAVAGSSMCFRPRSPVAVASTIAARADRDCLGDAARSSDPGSRCLLYL
jgi:hypothetical protein